MEILILISPCAVFDALGEIQIIKKKQNEKPYWKKKNKTLLEKEKQDLVTGNKGLS
jgi:hypothetical protein